MRHAAGGRHQHGYVTALCDLIMCVCMCLGLQVIIKCLKPVRQRKIKREIKILQVQPPPVPVCVFVHKAACLPARLLCSVLYSVTRSHISCEI